MPNLEFSIELGDLSVAEQIEAELLVSLRCDLEQSLNTSFTLSVKNPEDELIGGLVASTSYGWLLVKNLWVGASERRLGIGRSLMETAEVKARELNCHSVWLDTSSPQAFQFYSKLGYEVFGKLENTSGQLPLEHCRWFMRKTLTSN